MDKKQEIRERIELLNRAAKAYYMDAEEIMPNIEYDRLYDELAAEFAEAGFEEIAEERKEAFENGQTTRLPENQKAE